MIESTVDVSRWLAAEHLLFLDTETTGLGNEAEIIEIALVDRRGYSVFDSLVRPSGPVPPEATAIHGITDALLRHAPTWSEILDHVAAIISSRTVIAYNAPFDDRLIDQTCRRYGRRPPAYTSLCAMRAWLLGADLWSKGGALRPPIHGPAALWRAAKGTAHRAKDDCLATLALLESMTARPW